MGDGEAGACRQAGLQAGACSAVASTAPLAAAADDGGSCTAWGWCCNIKQVNTGHMDDNDSGLVRLPGS
jgi:hypothetical protein